MAHTHTWRTGEVTYEGFPLLLRYPDDIDFSVPNPRFPTLLAIEHKFDKTQNSGLPETAYNRGLEDFDVDLTGYIERIDRGVVVLVETFAGKRTYYLYVSQDLDLSAEASTIQQRYPEHMLTWEHKLDPSWEFISRYSREYGFVRR